MGVIRPSRIPGGSGGSEGSTCCDLCGKVIGQQTEYQIGQLAAMLCPTCLAYLELSSTKGILSAISPSQGLSHDHFQRDYSQWQREEQYRRMDVLDGHMKSVTAWSPQFAYQSSSFGAFYVSQESFEQQSMMDTSILDQKYDFTSLNNDGLSYLSLGVMLATGSTPLHVQRSAAPTSSSSVRGAPSDSPTQQQSQLADPALLDLPSAVGAHLRDQMLAFVGGAGASDVADDFVDEGFAEG